MCRRLYHLAMATCILGFATHGAMREIAFEQINYNGVNRLNCPPEKHIGNQPPDRHDSSLTLRQLRSEMSRLASVQGPPLDGYIVTSDDSHQTLDYITVGQLGAAESEALSPHDMRREFLTGFTGSAGIALVTANKAVFWTDGRYHIQADQQLNCNWILMKQGLRNVPTLTEWLLNEFSKKPTRIGADPTLIPASTWDQWEKELASSSINLIAIRNNLVDIIWQVNRPSYNPHAAYPLSNEFSGKPWQEKIRQVRTEMQRASADALVLTALDEIAWLFNIRGYDLPHTPVLRAYAVVAHGSIHLYAPRHKLLRSVDTHLKMDLCFNADCVKWHNYSSIWYDLKTMSQIWKKVWLPSPCGYSQGASKEIYNCIPREKQLPKPSPVINFRAEKNEIEIQGMRNAHIRDAVAMCDFIAYMEEQINLGSEGWDEMQVARVVNEFRLEQDYSKGISFTTIAGYGPHGAMPHYEPLNTTNTRIGKSSTLVIDSGGHYLDGTTDVTRTLHFGEPTQKQREAYTRILIGSIQLSSLTFPSDLHTNQIDALARDPLWNIGYDYIHGTGHGIGHFSSVHESPVYVSYFSKNAPNSGCNDATLKPGYFLSNEPGYYKENDFGVRLENVLEVVEAGKLQSNGKKFYKFQDVTLVPYEPKLIDTDMLSPKHRRWLNKYNQRIREVVGTELKKQLRTKGFLWMMDKTRSIAETGPIDRNFFLGISQANLIAFKLSQILLMTITVIFQRLITQVVFVS